MTRGELVPLVAVVGPTGVGKSSIAVEVAARLGGEIVSADSAALYRGMDAGTSKPDARLRSRVPHLLIDVADPQNPWTLADFRREAQRAIAEIHGRGRLPLLVGGTGQYVRALLEGWTPPRGDVRIREELEARARDGQGSALYAELRAVDPPSAGAIDARNVRRVVRALEVYRATGRRFSEARSVQATGYRALQIGLSLPRPELYRRLDERLEAMIAGGLVEEVRRLLEGGVPAASPPLSAIGYRQVAAYLAGGVTLDEALRQTRSALRRLVRHQGNWFRPDDPRIRWFEAGPEAVDQIQAEVQAWLEDSYWK